MSWKCLAMSVASTAPMMDLRASLNCGHIRHTLYMNSLLGTAARLGKQGRLLTACCLLCLLLTSTTHYLLPTTYYLLPTTLSTLTTCYLPLVEAGEYGAVGPQQ